MKKPFNELQKKDLLSVKGIGDVAASRILEHIANGGTIKSTKELLTVGKVQPQFSEDIDRSFDFQAASLVIDHDDIKVLSPDAFERFNSKRHYFTISLGWKSERDPNGYHARVVYRIYDQQRRKLRKQSFTVYFDPQGKANVNVQIRESWRQLDNYSVEIYIRDNHRNILAQTKKYVENGSEVAFELEKAKRSSILIKAEKVGSANYDGYTLNYEYSFFKPNGDLATTKNKLDLHTEDDIIITLESGEVVNTVTAEVISDRGTTIKKVHRKWEGLKYVDGKENQKLLPIELPEPYLIAQKVDIVDSPDDYFSKYVDHKIVVKYDLFEEGSLNFIRNVEEVFDIEIATGKKDAMFSLVEISHYGLVKDLIVQIKAPSGEVLAERNATIDEFTSSGDGFKMHFPHKVLFDVEAFERLPERPAKINGRLLDVRGKARLSDRQIILYVTNSEKDLNQLEIVDYKVLMVFETEEGGYFIEELPETAYYTHAFARVSHEVIDAGFVDVPIKLEPDEVETVPENTTDVANVEIVTRYFLPNKLLLVIDSEGKITSEKEDCDCDNTCGSLDFLAKNKVLDEFSYYMVVRTTEPEIQGYTLEDDGEMTIQEVIDTVNLQSSEELESLQPLLSQSIRKDILLKHVNGRNGLSALTLKKAIDEDNALKLKRKITPSQKVMARGRYKLSKDHQIDWDDEPTIYQAVTLAHGHLLQFKQEWKAAGYSIGNLINSLPLAPGQQKQIVVIDWEKRESAMRSEVTDFEEEMEHSLTRDTDINEMVKGVIKQKTKGGSKAKSSSFGAGAGGNFGSEGGSAVLGISGGFGKANSKAWQKSARNISMNASQQIHDSTAQAGAAMKKFRSTIVETATQGERYSVETETIGNYNHCHSLTIQYFEVLRHLEVHQRLANVQECLFVPLPISPFDAPKILRWKEDLKGAIGSRKLRKAFNAVERIENDYEGSDLPLGRYADETIETMEGSFKIKFNFSTPEEYLISTDREVLSRYLASLNVFSSSLPLLIDRVIEAAEKERIQIFQEHIAPSIALSFVDKLVVEFVDEYDNKVNTLLEPTLVSKFRQDKELFVSLRPDGQLPNWRRSTIKAISIKLRGNEDGYNRQNFIEKIPLNSTIIITKMSLNYRSRHFASYLLKNAGVYNDLLAYKFRDDLDVDTVRVSTPLNGQELRNPRNEDREMANELKDHLNRHLEYYHKVIWTGMDPSRMHMLLDGIPVNDYSDVENYPRGIVRSVASVVENTLIGFAGNAAIFPVSPGHELDNNLKGRKIDLKALYKPPVPFEPQRISIPTKGVYAEAVMGQCNSCEKIQEDRFWRWSQEPIPNSPTAINPVSTAPRHTEAPDLAPSQMPNSVLNIQNAPTPPSFQGLSGAIEALSNPNVFNDITGLSENQKNAIAAFQSSLSSANGFASDAAKMTEMLIKLNREGIMDEETLKNSVEELIKKSLTKMGEQESGNSGKDESVNKGQTGTGSSTGKGGYTGGATGGTTTGSGVTGDDKKTDDGEPDDKNEGQYYDKHFIEGNFELIVGLPQEYPYMRFNALEVADRFLDPIEDEIKDLYDLFKDILEEKVVGDEDKKRWILGIVRKLTGSTGLTGLALVILNNISTVIEASEILGALYYDAIYAYFHPVLKVEGPGKKGGEGAPPYLIKADIEYNPEYPPGHTTNDPNGVEVTIENPHYGAIRYYGFGDVVRDEDDPDWAVRNYNNGRIIRSVLFSDEAIEETSELSDIAPSLLTINIEHYVINLKSEIEFPYTLLGVWGNIRDGFKSDLEAIYKNHRDALNNKIDEFIDGVIESVTGTDGLMEELIDYLNLGRYDSLVDITVDTFANYTKEAIKKAVGSMELFVQCLVLALDKMINNQIIQDRIDVRFKHSFDITLDIKRDESSREWSITPSGEFTDFPQLTLTHKLKESDQSQLIYEYKPEQAAALAFPGKRDVQGEKVKVKKG